MFTFDGYQQFKNYMDSTWGEGNWSATIEDPIPKEFDFLEFFLGKKISITLDLWEKLKLKV